jgi:hypothetical protein
VKTERIREKKKIRERKKEKNKREKERKKMCVRNCKEIDK